MNLTLQKIMALLTLLGMLAGAVYALDNRITSKIDRVEQRINRQIEPIRQDVRDIRNLLLQKWGSPE